MQEEGWTVEVATEPDADGWLVKHRSDAEDDDLWSVSRLETFRR